jgi:hypothetical protein
VAIANVIEDGMGIDAAGTVYFVSVILTMLNLEVGGGALVLVAWSAMAIALRPRTGP